MRDKLLFGTIGLLVGIVVMQWTMPASQASYVAPGTGIVAAYSASGGDTYPDIVAIDQNGQQWRCFGIADPLRCWEPVNKTLPVPVSALKFWTERWLVTIDNHIWVTDGTDAWRDCGAWPGSPVASQQSTWGKVKAKFSGEKKQ